MKNKKLRQRISAVLMGAALTVSSFANTAIPGMTVYAQEETAEKMTEREEETGSEQLTKAANETKPEQQNACDLLSESTKPGITADLLLQNEENRAETSVKETQQVNKIEPQPEMMQNALGEQQSETMQNASEELKSETQQNASEELQSETLQNASEELQSETQQNASDEPRSEPQENASEELQSESLTEVFPETMSEALTETLTETLTEFPSETIAETETETEKNTEKEPGYYYVYTEKNSAVSFSFAGNDQVFAPGEQVKVRVTPNKGYMLKNVHVCIADAALDEEPAEFSYEDTLFCLSGEEVQASVKTLQTKASFVEEADGDTSVVLPDGINDAKDIEFEMPDSNVALLATVEYAEAEAIRSIKLNADPSLGFAYGPDGLKKEGTKLYIDKFEVTIKAADGDTITANAYCIQPALSNPTSGTYTEGTGNNTFQVLDEAGSGKNGKMARALYYLYGGPAWGKTIDGINMRDILKKYGCDDRDDYYCMTHYLLSYLYNPDENNWNAWFKEGTGKTVGVFNNQGKKCIYELADALDKLPAPVTELSASSLSSTVNSSGVSISGNMTYQSFEENTATVTLPAGVTLVTATGSRLTGTCKIPGGTTFHLEKVCTKAHTDTINITARYGTNFTAMKLQQTNKQNLAFAYYNGGELSFKVNWAYRPPETEKETQPPTERETQPATEPQTQPATEPETQPATEPETQPATEPETQPVTEPETEPETEPVPENTILVVKSDALTHSGPINGNYSFAGAKYTIYLDRNCTYPLETMYISASGTCESYMKFGPGTYYVTETTAPDCGLYELSSVVHTVSIPEGIYDQQFIVYDEEQPKQVRISVQKQDAETGEKVPQLEKLTFAGASYGLYADADCKELLETIITDENGYGISKEYPVSQYWMKELTAPEGYLPDEKVHAVTVSDLQGAAEAKNFCYSITSQEQIIRGDVTLTKRIVNGKGNTITKGLKGIEFTFTYVDDPKITFNVSDGSKDNTIATDSNGIASTVCPEKYPHGTLLYGTWEIKETWAPASVIKAPSFKVTVDRNGLVYPYTIDNDQIESHVLIEKRDAKTGNLIPAAGVAFRILDEEGNRVTMMDPVRNTMTDTWMTDAKGCVFLPDVLPYGDYVLQEVSGVPTGYQRADDLRFSVVTMNRNASDPLVVTVMEEPLLLPIRLNKMDAEEGTGIADTLFEVRVERDICDGAGEVRKGENADGEMAPLIAGTVVDRFVTDENGNGCSKPLYTGTYVVEEKQAAFGYAKTEDPRVVYVTGEETDAAEAGTFLNHKTKLTVMKTDAETKLPLANVTFEVIKKNSASADGFAAEAVDAATGDFAEGATHLITTNAEGIAQMTGFEKDTEYIVREMKTVDGYILNSEEITIHVDENGLIMGTYDYAFTMPNHPISLVLSKTDITGSKEIPGAKLTLRDEGGNVVESWISEEKPHIIQRLVPGVYSLTEELPPAGYVTAETITFTLNDKDREQLVQMKDDITKVEISKTDITNGKPVEGAVLVIRDENGNVVEEWTTTKEPHYIEMLPIGTYTLTEITAPEGYEVAETITFTVDDTPQIQKVTMQDQPVKEVPEVKPPKKTPDKPETPVQNNNGTPKTGDETPWEFYLLLMMAAAAIGMNVYREKIFK